MSRSAKITLIALCAAAIIGFALYYYLKDYIPKYRWNENYVYNNDQPYGLKLMYDLLDSTRTKDNMVFMDRAPKYILNKKDTSSLYIFIGANYICDSLNSIALANFVSKGNNVFISNIEAEHNLFTILTKGKRPAINYNTYEDSIVTIVINSNYSKHYTFDYKFQKSKALHQWGGLDSVFFQDTIRLFGAEKVSSINDGLVECYRFRHGKGWFIFHFNPVLFTNYNLSKKEGYQYLEQLFSEYAKPKIYWDEFSKSMLRDDSDGQSHGSPLRFVLSEKSLRWAWYLMVILMLLFIIFNSKRKQAQIPLLPDNRNTTVEFIHSIATLHHQHNSLIYMADEILKQFLAFVKYKYGISPHLDQQEIGRLLILKSGLNEETIRNIFKHYVSLKYGTVTEKKDLLEFYRLTEYFYQNCK